MKIGKCHICIPNFYLTILWNVASGQLFTIGLWNICQLNLVNIELDNVLDLKSIFWSITKKRVNNLQYLLFCT